MGMDASSEEEYVIKKAKLTHTSDPFAAKAWILTAKTLYPNNFDVQFEAYKLDKSDNNFKEAAKCFSYIILTFQNQPTELWNEVTQLTAALRITEEAPPLTAEQNFYVKMFEHISYEVQHKILLLIAGQSENNLEHCRLILLLMKRFPQVIVTHSPRLVETLLTGISANQPQFRELFINETLPLIQKNPPVLPSILVNRILAICFEHYIKLIYTSSSHSSPAESTADDTNAEYWQKLLGILDMCGRIMKWEPFLLFDKTHSKDLYWKRLYQIVSSTPPRPSENKQILFCATIVLMMSLHEYIRGCRIKIGDSTVEYILVQGFRRHELPSHALDNSTADPKRGKKREPLRDTPHISTFPPCSPDTSTWLVTATKCWQLLHSNDILQKDFKGLLRTVPTSDWVTRFVIDLSAYNATLDVAKGAFRNDLTAPSNELYMRLLSDLVSQTTFDMVELFDIMVALLNDLPAQTGTLLPTFSTRESARHLLLIPLTRQAIVQYCVKILVKALKQKIHGENLCTDTMLGNLLVLVQFDWPAEQTLAEQIFSMIFARRTFTYLNFSKYIICVDLLEQFMSLWYPHGGEVQLILDSAAAIALNAATLSLINTRRKGAEKALREDYRPIIKQQIRRCNEDVDALVTRFIINERLSLLANMFEK